MKDSFIRTWQDCKINIKEDSVHTQNDMHNRADRPFWGIDQIQNMFKFGLGEL
jgi:hypothetical protein